MARIGCLINLQKQIPKYNRDYLSVLVNRSFYYVSVMAVGYLNARLVKQIPVGIEISATNACISRSVYIDNWTLTIQYWTDSVVIKVIQGPNTRNCFVIQNNAIHGIKPGWVDHRFLTLDRSTIIALCIKNI